MAPIRPSTCLDCNVGRLVGVGECVFAHRFGADQQPYCILGKGRPTCRLEDFSKQIGHASPLACCAPHDSFRVSNVGLHFSLCRLTRIADIWRVAVEAQTIPAKEPETQRLPCRTPNIRELARNANNENLRKETVSKSVEIKRRSRKQ